MRLVVSGGWIRRKKAFLVTGKTKNVERKKENGARNKRGKRQMTALKGKFDGRKKRNGQFISHLQT